MEFMHNLCLCSGARQVNKARKEGDVGVGGQPGGLQSIDLGEGRRAEMEGVPAVSGQGAKWQEKFESCEEGPVAAFGGVLPTLPSCRKTSFHSEVTELKDLRLTPGIGGKQLVPLLPLLSFLPFAC